MPWIAIEQLQDKIPSVKEFNITVETLEQETKRRKNCTAPGIDGIQNFCWKKLEPARRELKRAFEQVRDKSNLILVCWSSRRTVLLPKKKNLTEGKYYRPVTCLNTSCKLLTALVGNI